MQRSSLVASRATSRANPLAVPLAVAAILAMTWGGSASAQTAASGLQLMGPEGTVELAELRFSNGNVVQFIGTADGDEVIYAETTPAGASESYLFGEDDVNVIERYLALTPDYVPVPRMLVAVSSRTPAEPEPGDGVVPDSQSSLPLVLPAPEPQPEPWRELVARRGIVERVTGPVYVDLGTIRIVPRTAASGGSCGAEGADYFEDHHCGTFDWHGYGVAEGYCFKNGADWIQKTSSNPMRVTYSRMAACGTGGETRHLRKKVGGWDTVLIGVSPPNTVASYWSTRTGIAWKRRTIFEAQNPGAGFVRGWVHYFKQVTG